MDVGDATFTTSMDGVKVGLEKQVGLELRLIQGWKIINLLEKKAYEIEEFNWVHSKYRKKGL